MSLGGGQRLPSIRSTQNARYLPRPLCSQAKSYDLGSTNQMPPQYTLTWELATQQPRSRGRHTLSVMAVAITVKASSGSRQGNSNGASCRFCVW